MKLDLFIQKTSNLYAKNILLRFLVLVMGGVLVVNSYYTYEMFRTQRVVIIPPSGLKERVEVGSSEASGEYIKMMTRYVVGLFLTYSPGNVRSQYSELLGLYGPESYVSVKSMLYDLADKIEMTDVTSIFHLHEITYTQASGETMDIEVRGVRVLYSKGRKLEEKNKRYVIESRIRNGRFYVKDLTEVQ